MNSDFVSELPSVTTDSEPWSTSVDLLHARDNAAPTNDVPCRSAERILLAPESPDFRLTNQELAAEATFSLSSTDVSPDKSSISMT